MPKEDGVKYLLLPIGSHRRRSAGGQRAERKVFSEQFDFFTRFYAHFST